MPAFQHRLRQSNSASPEHRRAMLEIGVRGVEGLRIESLEIEWQRITYTVESLEWLRSRIGPSRSLCFVMGVDAWNSLPKWHRWLEIVQFAHIIVVARPQCLVQTDGLYGDFLQIHKTDLIDDLANTSHGKVLFLLLTQMDISSTRIREMLGRKQSPRFLLPDAVLSYIETHQLYRPA
jgi:nicotinate-nucleotide adenylyltransferase